MFKELQNVDFPILEDHIRRGKTNSQDLVYQGIYGSLFPPPYPISQIHSHSSLAPILCTQIPSLCNDITPQKVFIPIVVSFQTILLILLASMVVPQGNAIGTLRLDTKNDLPRALQKNVSKFNGDGNVFVDEHIKALFATCSIIVSSI